MVQINFALREVNCKIVFYGPGMSGKTTNLEIVHKKAPEANKGELTSIATEGDRTLFFDFMPLDLGTIAGMRTRFQLYTVPGQVYYNSTRKLVLQGVDGLVFVADSSASKLEENLESLENLKNNLAEYGKDIREIALVIQYNKRDLPDAMSVEELNEKLNPWNCPYFEAVAITGEGVFPTLKCLSGLVLETLNRDERETAAAPAAPAAQAAPAAAVGAAAPKVGGMQSGFANVNAPSFQGGSAGTIQPGIQPGGGNFTPPAAGGGAQPPGQAWKPQAQDRRDAAREHGAHDRQGQLVEQRAQAPQGADPGAEGVPVGRDRPDRAHPDRDRRDPGLHGHRGTALLGPGRTPWTTARSCATTASSSTRT